MSLVSDIPAGDGKIANLFLQCILHNVFCSVSNPHKRFFSCLTELIILNTRGAHIYTKVRSSYMFCHKRRSHQDSLQLGLKSCRKRRSQLIPGWILAKRRSYLQQDHNFVHEKHFIALPKLDVLPQEALTSRFYSQVRTNWHPEALKLTQRLAFRPTYTGDHI